MSQNQINVPNIAPRHVNDTQTALSQHMRTTAKMREYRGLFANLIVQGLTLDIVKGTTSGRLCPQAELSNMITNKVGIQAANNDGGK